MGVTVSMPAAQDGVAGAEDVGPVVARSLPVPQPASSRAHTVRHASSIFRSTRTCCQGRPRRLVRLAGTAIRDQEDFP
ncbi:hypothetical protein GCM10028832_20060 [Streptomyces sparsus]